MSWDAFLVRIKGDTIPDEVWEAEELPLGSRGRVLDAIRQQFPDLRQQSNSEFVHLDGDLSIEFKLMGRSPVNQVMLEVRGEGDPITPLLELTTRNGWLVFDVSTSDYIDPKKPAGSGYGGYRKMVREITGMKKPTKRKTATKGKTATKAKPKGKRKK
jgi:hypothetical protein